MGTVNFGTSDIITLCILPYSEINNDDCEEENYSNDNLYNFEKDIIEDVIDHYPFENFELKLAPGYYESFYLDIVTLQDWDSYNTMEVFNKDVDRLQKCLEKLVRDCGMRVVKPGWCTTYYNESDSLWEVEQAIENYTW